MNISKFLKGINLLDSTVVAAAYNEAIKEFLFGRYGRPAG